MSGDTLHTGTLVGEDGKSSNTTFWTTLGDTTTVRLNTCAGKPLMINDNYTTKYYSTVPASKPYISPPGEKSEIEILRAELQQLRQDYNTLRVSHNKLYAAVLGNTPITMKFEDE